MCGDAIVNYKTVQSFGHEDMLVEKYKQLLEEPRKDVVCHSIKVGVALGFSQLAQFGIFAALFFFGGLIIEADFPNTTAEDVFIALFAIMFGAS